MKKNILLRTENLVKKFPGVIALDSVSVTFEEGKIHALLGKNGSGKSTLVNIFAGTLAPSSGAMYVAKEKVTKYSVDFATRYKIAIVYQEMSLVDSMSVAENLFLSIMSQFVSSAGIIAWDKVYSEAKMLLEKFKLSIDPKNLVSDLSMGEKQMLEILKAIAHNPKILILDEPSSSLSVTETSKLFEFLKRFRKQGGTIIYITHKLQELREIVDTVTILRDGAFIGQENLDDISDKKLLDMMFGDEPHAKIIASDRKIDKEIVLAVKDLVCAPYNKPISFDLKRGEILGIAGMLGSGRTELLRAIYGLEHPESGSIKLLGEDIKKNNTPKKMKRRGVGFVSEDRRDEGLFLSLPISFNLTIASLWKNAIKGFVNFKNDSQMIEDNIKDLEIKVSDIEAPAGVLSGGNQQKIVIGNWLNCQSKIIFFDEPSRGIDVRAKRQIFEFMFKLAQKQTSSIFVSTELEELLEVCDRILVLNKGQITQEIISDNISVSDLYALTMKEEKNEAKN